MPTVDLGGEWLPDRPRLVPGSHLYDATNVLAGAGYYRPVKTLVETTGALPSRCRGVFPMRDKDNAGHMYAGDVDALWELEGTTWTDRSKSGGYTTAGTTTRWRFAQYGDRVLATNGLDAIQYIDASTAATEFADLPGTPGTAKFVTSYGEFVVLGALGSNSNSIKWSALGDSEGWTAGVGQSDSQEFADGGNITGMVATKAAVYVFQEHCVRRVLYVGGALIMQIDKLFEGIGCIEPNSLVAYGQRCFFLAENGWYMWDFEGQPVNIGNEKFDRWFQSYAVREYWYAMSAAIDPVNQILSVGFAGEGSDLLTNILFYNFALGRASYGYLSVQGGALGLTTEMLVPAISTFTSIDSLTDNLDTDYTVSFDDPFWQGGTFYFAAFTPNHKLASFSGGNARALLQSSMASLYDGRRAAPQWIKPITDAPTVTGYVWYQVKPGDDLTGQIVGAQQASGRCPVRGANGFYHGVSVQIETGEDWTYIRGVEFDPGTSRGVR